MKRAVVFAYHDVGVRCLSVLLAHGMDVALVITHEDDPAEQIWFQSVAALAREHRLPLLTPADPNIPELVERVRALRPDFLFSFYYRKLLGAPLLKAAGGAFNMHGSLLPKYRGRAPVNWAIIRGERETGATLHEMVEQPDAGRIVDQQPVPILPNDTAIEVFRKVTVAAEMVLDRSLLRLLAGTASLKPQDLSAGSYYGRRTPEAGRIDWTRSAWEIHNLVRAVAPPYPGAFADVRGRRLRLLRTLWLPGEDDCPGQPALLERQGEIYVRCIKGGLLRVIEAELDGRPLRAGDLRQTFGTDVVRLSS
ncbi:formyltransferase [Pelomicrobium methylotrophicum]|uniref:Formyltransferase n=1 Tax=Pelomicrobium methylotrophicum TaxID=2602750 RepID=A0A5C7EHI8_9PROT|nr:formyltransferase [Pelomicrobium methylotrophicum]TXF11506.1 formyltransferase [Pelomicrobium methylotrophicum]